MVKERTESPSRSSVHITNLQQMSTIEKALSIALEAHTNQKDKAGAAYILHPIRVMMRMKNDEAQKAALLHDVIEDSELSLDDLRDAGFSSQVVAAVDHLTRRKNESYEDFVARTAEDPIARKVKRADLEENMDLRRLKVITAVDLQRLQRYRKAWEKLQ